MQPFDDVHGVEDRPWYTNVRMPWPTLPPHPPAANPAGVYERDVDVPADWAGRRVVLHVGAAESVLIASLDGVEIGISKDGHLAAVGSVPQAHREITGGCGQQVARRREGDAVQLALAGW